MWIEPERLAQAKSIDLYSYLAAAEPGNIKRCGQDEYCLRDHDSLKVSVSTGKWNWHSRGFGGTTAVQYLITVRGYPLPEAAQMVLDSKAAPYSPLAESPPARPLALPQHSGDDSRVIRYLCGQRGLCREVVEHCRALGTLYESARYHSCVFVGHDEQGTPRHAAIRATGGDFKRDAEGSDKPVYLRATGAKWALWGGVCVRIRYRRIVGGQLAFDGRPAVAEPALFVVGGCFAPAHRPVPCRAPRNQNGGVVSGRRRTGPACH